MKRTLSIFLLMILCSTFALAKPRHRRSPRECVAFPPSRQSLLLQNQTINQLNLERISDERRLRELVNYGTLVALPSTDAVQIAPSLPSNRRYVLPMTRDFILVVASEYYAEFGLPLQVNSAVRPMTVQSRLRRWNHNAAPVHGDVASSHEAGCTVDLERTRLTAKQRAWLQMRLLYYSALGYVLVEEERACFHTMVAKEQQ